MPHRFTPIKIELVGRSPGHTRFVVRNARRLVSHYWTGRRWSRRLQDARLNAIPDLVAKTIKALTRRHLRRHLPKRLVSMTVLVRVHAVELVSRVVVERYLRDALIVGVDHERCEIGPTDDSLVEIVVSVISREAH